jgi:hypothetical protein
VKGLASMSFDTSIKQVLVNRVDQQALVTGNIFIVIVVISAILTGSALHVLQLFQELLLSGLLLVVIFLIICHLIQLHVELLFHLLVHEDVLDGAALGEAKLL